MEHEMAKRTIRERKGKGVLRGGGREKTGMEEGKVLERERRTDTLFSSPRGPCLQK